jgi:polysaccharide pyruvyl transferase WcaK-like protein
MHSQIFAISQGVPVVAIGYLAKTRGMLQMLGLERWYVHISKANGGGLAQLLAALWDERAQVRAHLELIVPAMVEQASGCGAEIAADYAELAEPLSS